ncbi:MAG: DUF885 family protein [Vicinamibacterales bacterium]|nr:DUF885 family protein [Vicinamibacterales bacterium]
MPYPSEPFPHFVDDVLAYLYEALPGRASLDGLHLHDDLLEDFSRQGVDTHARTLAGFSRRLSQIDRDGLSESERIDHRILSASLDAHSFDLERVRGWERSPLMYAATLGTALAAPTFLAYAPDAERARRLLSRLRQVPRFTKACQDNIKEPAALLVKIGTEAWRGVRTFIDRDLPRGFASLDDLHILGDLADASHEASEAVAACIDHFDKDVAPRAKASFRQGTDVIEHYLKRGEGIGVSAERLVQLGLQWLSEAQEEFRQVAGRIESGEPADVWRRLKAEHLLANGPLEGAAASLNELSAYLNKQTLVAMQATDAPSLSPTPDFERWKPAGLWVSGAFETRPTRPRVVLTGADAAWTDERRREHLLDLNSLTRTTLLARESHPGRLSLAVALGQVDSKVRKSALFVSRTFQDGWAHYAEQALFDSGFRRGDHAARLGQLAETLVGLSRLVVAIRLHSDDLSVEQGVRFFREEAYLEESTARREAERGVFDPGYMLQAVGKRLLLRLKSDYEEQQAGKTSVRAFHDALLANGALPIWAHRQLLLGDRGALTLD